MCTRTIAVRLQLALPHALPPLIAWPKPAFVYLIATVLLLASNASTQAFHTRRPNNYSRTDDSNAATRLNTRLANGELQLDSESKSSRGRLRALLKALQVPESSQTLVFSKTSLQRHRVSPKNPRALYFNKDV